MPKARTVDKIKSEILQPATTSHFEVSIPKPPGLSDGVLNANGVNFPLEQEKLNLLCSEAFLPGSSLATLELDNDYTGVTERHAYRRVYDDRIDLTFYVDAKNYLPIKFFETWIKYISGEEISEKPDRGVGVGAKNYFYRMRYPDDYTADKGLQVTKFEKDLSSVNGGSSLVYKFVRAYPISITSMPVSYDSSSLLKCTVSLTYIRYFFSSVSYKGTATKNLNKNPEQQAAYNAIQFGDDIEALDIAYQEALESGDGDAIEAADIARRDFFRQNNLPSQFLR